MYLNLNFAMWHADMPKITNSYYNLDSLLSGHSNCSGEICSRQY